MLHLEICTEIRIACILHPLVRNDGNICVRMYRVATTIEDIILNRHGSFLLL